MQPILILAIVAVAAIGLGTGFLNNDFVVMVQQFGIGQGNIDTPIQKATVDFVIAQVGPDAAGFFKNVINECTVTLDASNGFGDPQNTAKESELWCKLTDMNHNIIAENHISALAFPPGIYHIPIPAQPLATAVDDVTIIAHANTYTNYKGYVTPPPP